MKICIQTDYMEKYIIVKETDAKYIDIIYGILRSCGWNMAKKGMFHWIPFYSKRSIRKDCQSKVVVLVWDDEQKDYTSTFQMYKMQNNNLYVRKIATLPEYEGRGIGKRNLLYMENYAKDNRCSKICLDVYRKSKRAIAFYEHANFNVVGTKRSIRFRELIMEKQI